MKKHYWC